MNVIYRTCARFSCSLMNGCNNELIYFDVFLGVKAEEILSSFLLFQSIETAGGRPNNSLVFVACGSAAVMLGTRDKIMMGTHRNPFPTRLHWKL